MRPYVCPVCQGRQTVSPGYYDAGDTGSTTALVRETCRTCNGLGIVWSPMEPPGSAPVPRPMPQPMNPTPWAPWRVTFSYLSQPNVSTTVPSAATTTVSGLTLTSGDFQ